MKNTRVPTKIMLGACVASHRAVREMQEDGELPGRVKVRSSQYLNNLGGAGPPQSEPMLAFKRFDNAVVTISGIELAEKIKKGQFKPGKLGGCRNYGTRHSQLELNSQSLARRSLTDPPVSLILHQSLQATCAIPTSKTRWNLTSSRFLRA